MLKPLLFAVLPLAAGQQGEPVLQSAAQEPGALARVARTAAFHYESLQRRLAPATFDGGRRADQCDERIGRFCFWYDSPTERPAPPPPAEPPEVADARTVAVRAHRRWFAVEPGHPEAAGFLIRYLVESERPGEAVAAARAHAWAADRSAESLLTLGLALHHAGDFEAAEAVFDSARAAVDEERRRELDDVGMLLDRRERGRYSDLSREQRERYNARFWALSDPSLLQPGNERRSAHYARHAWVRIFAEAPRVRGMISWGSDHEEILMRFGIPTSRRRIRDFQPHLLSADPRFIESFDPDAVALVPPAMLTRGLPFPPPPGVRHELARDTSPSVYAPVRLRLRPLDHVASRIPRERATEVRFHAILPPDTIAPGVPIAPRAAVILLDTLGTEMLRADADVRTEGDSTFVTGAIRVPDGAWVYRVELLDDSTGLAGLAQYRLDVPGPAAVLATGTPAGPDPDVLLSDLIVAEAFGETLPASVDDPALVPYPSLVLPTGTTVGLFAEARGLRRDGQYAVEWSVEPESEGSIIGRAFRWLGRQLGVVDREEPLRIRWEDVAGGGRAPIAVNMDLSEADAGLYRITLTILNGVTGQRRTAERLLRLSDATWRPARD